MMLGKVAPAPLSFTWAVAGATTARVAASASSGDFVMVDASSGLERELHLEQPSRPLRIEVGGGARLVRHVVDVREHPEVGRDLIGDASDDARLPIATYAGVRIDDVDSRDHGDAAARDVVDAEAADDATRGVRTPAQGREGVLRRCEFTGEGELFRAVGQHADEPVAVAPARALAEAGVAGEPQAAHTAVVVGLEQADGDARHQVLAVVPPAAAVAFTVHDRELAVDLVVLPLAVDPGAEVRGRSVTVAVERHGALHAVVPQRLFPVEPRRVEQAELVGEVAAGGRPRGERVLEPQHLVPAAVRLEVTRHTRLEAARELADHVDVGALDRELILVPGAQTVLELVQVLAIDDATHRHLRWWWSGLLGGQWDRARRGGHDGHPERPTNGVRHWVSPLLGESVVVVVLHRGKPSPPASRPEGGWVGAVTASGPRPGPDA